MGDEKPSIQRQVEEVSADMLKSRFERIANSLRRLAGAAERASEEATDVLDGKRPSYSDIAGRIQHEVLWGLANLGLDSLVSAAHDADEAKAVQRTREKIAQAITAHADANGDGSPWDHGMGVAAEVARQYGEADR